MVNFEKLLDRQRVYQGRRVNLRVDTVELASGRRTTREIVEYPDSVVIVAVDSGGKVLLVRQYRSAVGKSLLEIPAGKKEPNESPIEAAQRELCEETGYSARRIEPLGGFYSGPGYSTEFLHLFLAFDLERSPAAMNTDEITDVVPVNLAEVPHLIARGEICDAKSIAGLLRVIVERSVSEV